MKYLILILVSLNAMASDVIYELGRVFPAHNQPCISLSESEIDASYVNPLPDNAYLEMLSSCDMKTYKCTKDIYAVFPEKDMSGKIRKTGTVKIRATINGESNIFEAHVFEKCKE